MTWKRNPRTSWLRLIEDVQYTGSCTQKIARLLLELKEPELVSWAHETLTEAFRSMCKLKRLQKRL
jgi:hypothetical protein